MPNDIESAYFHTHSCSVAVSLTWLNVIIVDECTGEENLLYCFCI